MRIGEYCRLFVKKYPHDEYVKMFIRLLKDASIMRDTLHSIEIMEWVNPKTFRKNVAHATGGMQSVISPDYLSISFSVYIKTKPHTYNFKQMICILAHELGHVISLKEKGDLVQISEYLGRINNSQFLFSLLGDKESWEDIMTEEMVAWAHARKMLRAIGWTDWAYFEAERKDCLSTYDYRDRG